MSRNVRELKAQSRNLLEMARGLRPLKTKHFATMKYAAAPASIAVRRRNRMRMRESGAGYGTLPTDALSVSRSSSSTAPSPSSSDALPCETTARRARSDYHHADNSTPSTPPGSRAQHPRVKQIKVRMRKRPAACAKTEQTEQHFERSLLFSEQSYDTCDGTRAAAPRKELDSDLDLCEGSRPRSLSKCGEDVSAAPAEICAAKEGHVVSQLRILRAAAAQQQQLVYA